MLTLEDWREVRRRGLNGSLSPRLPIIETFTSEVAGEREDLESRDEATAWLAPFPPGWMENEVPVRVSPAEGTRAVVETRSTFREPITVIFLGAILKVLRGF